MKTDSNQRQTLTSTVSQTQEAGFATANEAARYLKLSKAMIHKLIGQGTVPVCRYGRAVRIPWNWLRAQVGE